MDLHSLLVQHIMNRNVITKLRHLFSLPDKYETHKNNQVNCNYI